MEADDRDVDWRVSPEEARAELDRLLADPDFQSTERNKNFLRFVAERAFEGRENTIKAYSIAVDVFGRPCSFDPATDPIVRIEATRLRASLSRYYELHGDRSAIRIDLPKGRYVPVFMRLAAGIDADSGLPADPFESFAMPAAPGADGLRLLWSSVGPRWAALGLGGLAGLGVGALLLFLGLQADVPVVSERPSVDIAMAGAPSDAEALEIRDALMVALSQFQTVRVLTDPIRTQAIAPGGRGGARPIVRSNAYHAALKYDPSDRSVWWQIVETATGEAVQSGVERVPGDLAEEDLKQALVTRLAIRIGGLRGVINDAETARELEEPSLGNGCVLRAAVALQDAGKEALPAVRSCLEATLAIRPNDADAHAALAAILLRMDKPEAPTDLTSVALDMANRAVALAPRSDRSRAALMNAQFRNGQTEAAIVAGRRALELNPRNAAATARLGSLLFKIGQWDEGVALVQRAGEIESEPYREAEVTLALDAYRRGEFEEALLRVQQLGETDCYCVNVLRVAALGRLGRSKEAILAADMLRRWRPGIERTFRSDMDARHFDVALTDALQLGLAKAGIVVE